MRSEHQGTGQEGTPRKPQGSRRNEGLQRREDSSSPPHRSPGKNQQGTSYPVPSRRHCLPGFSSKSLEESDRLLWPPSREGSEESGTPSSTNFMCPGSAQRGHWGVLPPWSVCRSEGGRRRRMERPRAFTVLLGTQELDLNRKCHPSPISQTHGSSASGRYSEKAGLSGEEAGFLPMALLWPRGGERCCQQNPPAPPTPTPSPVAAPSSPLSTHTSQGLHTAMGLESPGK